MRLRKERRGVDEMSEDEARKALGILDRGDDRTSLDRPLDAASVDDESKTSEERRAVEEARKELRRGEGIP